MIPILAYSFLGIEIVAVAAYEAQKPESLKRSSQIIPYVVTLLNIVSAVADCLNVKWTNNALLAIDTGPETGDSGTLGGSAPRSSSLMIIAAANAGLQNVPGLLNGCFIFSVLSAANTSLYASSRTLYGLARDSKENSRLGRWFYKLSDVNPHTKIPLTAVVVSMLAFFWLPFLHLLKNEYADAEVMRSRFHCGEGHSSDLQLVEIVATSAGVSGILVWAMICLAYIQYDRWHVSR